MLLKGLKIFQTASGWLQSVYSFLRLVGYGGSYYQSLDREKERSDFPIYL
jgi:hypothetical protein